MSSSDHEQATVEQDGVGSGEQVPAPASLSAKKLWRMVRAVHLVLVRGLGKHRPKLAALGVNLHHMLSSSSKRHHHHHLGAASRDQSPALMTYLSAALSCRSMDPGAAVHPYPSRGSHGGNVAAGISSLSCRSMDPGAAVYQQYQYRPREVEFSCKSTPLHRRRRRAHRHRDQGLLLQQPLGDLPEYGSTTAVKTLFELIDGDDDDDGDMETPIPWAASAAVGRTAPRQVRITDSPFLAKEDGQEGSMDVVDRRADEFILWFHDQLRMQQQQQRPDATDRATYWVR